MGVILLGILNCALKGKYVGIVNLDNGIWKVFLGFFNENNIRDKQVSIRLSQNMV